MEAPLAAVIFMNPPSYAMPRSHHGCETLTGDAAAGWPFADAASSAAMEVHEVGFTADAKAKSSRFGIATSALFRWAYSGPAVPAEALMPWFTQ